MRLDRYRSVVADFIAAILLTASVSALLSTFIYGEQKKPRAAAPPIPGLPPFTMEFISIPHGEFEMGCSDNGNEKCFSDEKPVHLVRLTKDYELGKYEVTQLQWEIVMLTFPGRFSGDKRPVEMVSWDDTQRFLARLNDRKDGYIYRLPTEAEWEYAARAGGLGEVFPDNLSPIAWFDRNSGGQTHEVGEQIPNAWGLYDMYGNVFEWVQDWYSATYYSSGEVTNPTGPSKGERHVLRGGSWLYGPNYARPSIRFFNIPTLQYMDLGFRCARQKIESQ